MFSLIEEGAHRGGARKESDHPTHWAIPIADDGFPTRNSGAVLAVAGSLRAHEGVDREIIVSPAAQPGSSRCAGACPRDPRPLAILAAIRTRGGSGRRGGVAPRVGRWLAGPHRDANGGVPDHGPGARGAAAAGSTAADYRSCREQGGRASRDGGVHARHCDGDEDGRRLIVRPARRGDAGRHDGSHDQRRYDASGEARFASRPTRAKFSRGQGFRERDGRSSVELCRGAGRDDRRRDCPSS